MAYNKTKTTFCDYCRDSWGGILESRLVARIDDLNRNLTDEETLLELNYIIETMPYSGHEEKFVNRIIKACKNLKEQYKKQCKGCICK